MASLNKVMLIGHLGADPEIRRTQDGRPIANLRLATSDTWRDKNSGERREKTEWHRVVIFTEGLCKVAESYLKKGSKIYVEGQLSTRKWQGQDGQDRYSTEIVLQGFNGTLVMLDRAGNGCGYRQGGDGPEDHGFDGDRASGSRDAAGAQSSSRDVAGTRNSSQSGGSNFNRDMDDDIPF